MTMSTAFEIARALMQIKAIILNPQNPFTWASGLRSPIYCDNRLALSYPEVRSFLVEKFVQRSPNFKPFNYIAGVATAGIPHGTLLADRLNLPFVYVRPTPKSHGRQNLIEGILPTDARVLVVEDLISTGGSCLQAVRALQDHGAQVSGVMAIFSYNFPVATLAFAEASCKFETLSNFDALLTEAVNTGYIGESEKNLLLGWSKDPAAWSEQFIKQQNGF